MTATETARAAPRRALDDLSQTLFEINGLLIALDLIAGDLGLDDAGRGSAAFHALREAAEARLATAIVLCDRAIRNSRKGGA